MLHTMYSAQGVGLAAPQVGKNLRLVVVDVGEGPLCLVNPVLDQFEGTQLDQEGCLSLPGVVGDVRRAAKVRVEALDENGKPVRFIAEGLLARCLQHEVDHLDGILFIDRAIKVREA